MFGFFRKRPAWPVAGGVFDLDLRDLFAFIANQERGAQPLRDGTPKNETQYCLYLAMHDVVVACAYQIAEQRTFQSMMGLNTEIKNDFFHPFVLTYIAGASLWAAKYRFFPKAKVQIAQPDIIICKNVIDTLYGYSADKAFSILGASDLHGAGFQCGYGDASVLIERVRDHKDTAGIKRLAIFMFEDEIAEPDPQAAQFS